MICPFCKKRDTKGNRICEECFVASVSRLEVGKKMEIDIYEKIDEEEAKKIEAELRRKEKAEEEARIEANKKLNLQEVLGLPIAELCLSQRILNRLDHLKIRVVKDLLMFSQHELLKLGNLGQVAIKEIMQSLQKYPALFGRG